jgi:apolipoprotein D and lipocalin family protein
MRDLIISLRRASQFFALAFTLISCQTTAKANSESPLETVALVDLARYQGVWYEIASFPKWFARGCVNSQATYTLRDDERVDVLNECRKKTPDGRRSVAKGIARVVDEESNAKLKVRFGWAPFEGDYWIIELEENYKYVVVSEPSRDSLWILSRSTKLSAEVLEPLLERLEAVHGLDTSRLVYTRIEN